MTALTAPARPVSLVTRLLTVLLATVATLVVVGASPASAASQLQAANCNKNFSTGERTLVVRAPKIWSNSGTGQTVRYRSQLWKWNGTGWSHKQDGTWRSGTAYPNSPWQDASRPWDLRPYGGGHYVTRIQVQYLSGGSWTGLENGFVGTYYVMTYANGTWSHVATTGYCTI